MIKKLNQQSVRVMKIKGPGAIPVRFRFLRQRNAMIPEPFSPFVYVFRPPDDDTYMMDQLILA
jgi:hypothetical protein